MLSTAKQRGDTLIEVMLAVVILSMVTVGAMSIMNRGNATSLGVLERTEVRAKISEQMELLHYLRDQYAKAVANNSPRNVYPANQWLDIYNNRSNATTANTTEPTSCTPHDQSFYVARDTSGAYMLRDYTHSDPATTPTAGEGLWIEAARSPSSVEVSYVDFYVKACWDTLTGGPQQVITSTMRLYHDS